MASKTICFVLLVIALSLVVVDSIMMSTSDQPTSSQPTVSGSGLSTGAPIDGGAAVGAAVAVGGEICSSDPTHSKGNGVTDEDLEKLSEALFRRDKNNANSYITLNLQKQTTDDNPEDLALQPLFTVNPDAFRISTIRRVIALYDNYQVDTGMKENLKRAERDEEIALVNEFLSTNVMCTAMRFLADKGFVEKKYETYTETLGKLWFSLYAHDGENIGSAGVERVFLAEVDHTTKVIGLHNWIYFSDQEKKNHAKYLGYIQKVNLGDKACIIKIYANYRGVDKLVTTMFVGTSPELELALYTVCFNVRQDRPCPVSLGGTKFNITTKTFRYKGKEFIDTAYPDI